MHIELQIALIILQLVSANDYVQDYCIEKAKACLEHLEPARPFPVPIPLQFNCDLEPFKVKGAIQDPIGHAYYKATCVPYYSNEDR